MQQLEKPLYSTVESGIEATQLYHKMDNRPFFPRTHADVVQTDCSHSVGQLLKMYEQRLDALELYAIGSGDADVTRMKIVDNVVTSSAVRALSARQGKRLYDVMDLGPVIGIMEQEDSPLGVLGIREGAIARENLDESLQEKMQTIDDFEGTIQEIRKQFETIGEALISLDERLSTVEGMVEESTEHAAYIDEVNEYILRILHDRVKASIKLSVFDAVTGDWAEETIPADHLLMDGVQAKITWDLKDGDHSIVPLKVSVYQVTGEGDILLSDRTTVTTVIAMFQNLAEALSIDVKVVAHFGYIDFEATDVIVIDR